MDLIVYLNKLYDYYGNLLTEKQQHVFEEYYFNDLSLKEISEEKKVSRNAIHKQLKDIVEKLKYYESKLNLVEKNAKINLILEQVDDEVSKRIKELI